MNTKEMIIDKMLENPEYEKEFLSNFKRKKQEKRIQELTKKRLEKNIKGPGRPTNNPKDYVMHLRIDKETRKLAEAYAIKYKTTMAEGFRDAMKRIKGELLDVLKEMEGEEFVGKD